MYIIVGGAEAGEGAVITRDPSGIAKVSQTELPEPAGVDPVWRFQGRKDRWHVQTNWDDWSRITAAKCRAKMANLTSGEEKLCEEFIKVVYDDPKQCSELCALYSDGRLEVGEASMQALMGDTHAAISYAKLFEVMAKPPVHAGDTLFTPIMSVTTGYYNTTVWGAGGNACVHAVRNEARQEKMQRLEIMGRALVKALLQMQL
jgi:hypothetical protein